MVLAVVFGGGAGAVGVGGDNEGHAALGAVDALAGEVVVVHAGNSLACGYLVDSGHVVHTDGEGVKQYRLTGSSDEFDAVNQDVTGHGTVGGHVKGQ